MPLPYVCENSKSPGQIQKDIQKMIQNIQNAKKGLKDFKKSVTHPIQFEGRQVSVQEYVSIQVEKASKVVATFVSDRISGAQEWITRKINNGLKDLYFFFFPDEQSDIKVAVENAMDLLACLFKKILKNVLNIVRKALLSIVDRYINVPLCAAENILASILGKLSGLIIATVAQIMKLLEPLLGSVVDIVDDILGFVEGILSYLSCEEKPKCPKIEDWSLWDGASIPTANFDPTSLINKVKKFAGQNEYEGQGIINEIGGGLEDIGDINFDFEDLIESFDDCETGAIFCGPPNVVFWGGSGSNTTGNVIVSALNDVLGVDIVNTGSGYGTISPFISFEDSCGKGVGASGRAILGPVSLQDDGTYQSDPNGTETGVVGVVVEDPGYGYLPSPDGSQGGDGRVWADADQTTVKKSDGIWEIPYDVGEIIEVSSGDVIYTPVGSSSQIISEEDTIKIPGGVSFVSPINGTVIAPQTTMLPVSDIKQYSVVLYLCDTIITNPGVGYQPGDKIIVEPSYGVELEPTFNQLGQLVSVKVISGGEGIKEVPTIYIESETGFNAKIVPRLCIDRIGADEFAEPIAQDKIISVIDCVGKF